MTEDIYKNAAERYAADAREAQSVARDLVLVARTEADRADRWRAVAGVLTLVVCVLLLVVLR